MSSAIFGPNTLRSALLTDRPYGVISCERVLQPLDDEITPLEILLNLKKSCDALSEEILYFQKCQSTLEKQISEEQKNPLSEHLNQTNVGLHLCRNCLKLKEEEYEEAQMQFTQFREGLLTETQNKINIINLLIKGLEWDFEVKQEELNIYLPINYEGLNRETYNRGCGCRLAIQNIQSLLLKSHEDITILESLFKQIENLTV